MHNGMSSNGLVDKPPILLILSSNYPQETIRKMISGSNRVTRTGTETTMGMTINSPDKEGASA